jgi:hypothetical protein
MGTKPITEIQQKDEIFYKIQTSSFNFPIKNFHDIKKKHPQC